MVGKRAGTEYCVLVKCSLKTDAGRLRFLDYYTHWLSRSRAMFLLGQVAHCKNCGWTLYLAAPLRIYSAEVQKANLPGETDVLFETFEGSSFSEELAPDPKLQRV